VKGGKWDGLFHTLKGRDLSGYERIWLPDDDIACSAADIDAMFAAAATHGLAVCQPALTEASYFTHFLFLRCPGFALRYTNYVEIMVPCLTRAVLERALPLFDGTMSGYGLDYVWCRFPESGPFRCGVLDTVAVHHTRPIGGALKKVIAGQGTTSQSEEAVLKARYGLTARTVPLTFAGIRADGTPVAGRLAMALAMGRAWGGRLGGFRDPAEARGGLIKVLRRQVLKPMEFSPLRQVD
jgi:hypothetical protein